LIHDPELLERLSAFPTASFDGEAFRATPMSLDPLTPSTRGGRWAPTGEVSVLYTSKEREGALAEIAFHWGQLTPLPSKPAALHRLRLTTRRTLRLIQTDLVSLGVDLGAYRSVNYVRTQVIGAAVAFLERDGLIIPSARWDCENLVLFTDNHDLGDRLEVAETEAVDWRAWARERQLFDEPDSPADPKP
jgi:RES domain-containing protein